jgi:hypothetical protein
MGLMADSRSDEARWDFFVSYTEADVAWAEWVSWQLERAGYGVLVQKWDMVPGAHWMVTMQEGMTRARRTIAVVSAAYLASVYGQQEWQAAVQDDPHGFARKLLPVRVEDCPRPGPLGQIVSTDLFGMSEEAARQHLLDTITTAINGRAKPGTSPTFPGQPWLSPAFPGHETPRAPQPPPPRHAVAARGLARPISTGLAMIASAALLVLHWYPSVTGARPTAVSAVIVIVIVIVGAVAGIGAWFRATRWHSFAAVLRLLQIEPPSSPGWRGIQAAPDARWNKIEDRLDHQLVRAGPPPDAHRPDPFAIQPRQPEDPR